MRQYISEGLHLSILIQPKSNIDGHLFYETTCTENKFKWKILKDMLENKLTKYRTSRYRTTKYRTKSKTV